jgi:hypothetical protein
MSAATTSVNAVDPDGRWLYRVGGISALLLGAAYIIIFPLYAHVGAPPGGSDGETWLKYLTGRTTVWWAILGLSVLTDFLFVPVALALYLALKGIHRNAMLVATAFVGLFVVLDLAITWSHYASLLTLAGNYTAAANDLQRSTYVAAASYASAMLASRLLVVYAIVVLSSAILMIGIVMLKGIFSKTTAYLGVITGILGIVSFGGFFVTIMMNAVLATVWLLLVGYRLYRLAER